METSEYYDSFLLQARGRDQADGNATLVGEFVRAPQICRYLDCLSKEDSRLNTALLNIRYKTLPILLVLWIKEGQLNLET